MKKENLCNIVKNTILVGVVSTVLVSGAKFYWNKFSYDHSLIGERIVQKGDNLTKYARAEDLTKQKEIDKYISAMQRANNYYVNTPSGPKIAVGSRGEIYQDAKILMLDINNDGKVGTREKLNLINK